MGNKSPWFELTDKVIESIPTTTLLDAPTELESDSYYYKIAYRLIKKEFGIFSDGYTFYPNIPSIRLHGFVDSWYLDVPLDKSSILHTQRKIDLCSKNFEDSIFNPQVITIPEDQHPVKAYLLGLGLSEGVLIEKKGLEWKTIELRNGAPRFSNIPANITTQIEGFLSKIKAISRQENLVCPKIYINTATSEIKIDPLDIITFEEVVTSSPFLRLIGKQPDEIEDFEQLINILMPYLILFEVRRNTIPEIFNIVNDMTQEVRASFYREVIDRQYISPIIIYLRRLGLHESAITIASSDNAVESFNGILGKEDQYRSIEQSFWDLINFVNNLLST